MPASNDPVPTRAPGIVAIGASAGGLQACRQFLDTLPKATGSAFLLVQHLDPTHDSMLVDLLTPHTHLIVTQAAHGTMLAAEHLYIIPPAAALAVRHDRIVLSAPTERHGARLPFDGLLRSLADSPAAPRCVAVILSGSGSDGTLGAVALREAGGFVLAQEPSEAAFDGMPGAAIAAGAVDRVLPVAQMAEAMLNRSRAPPAPAADDRLADIVAALRQRTGSDFSLYKPGTLRRRIGRRMGLAGIAGLDKYLALLNTDPAEATLLAKDLLIHVTGFFRDPEVFTLLAERVIPDMLAAHKPDHPLRIWVAGCSTGEETWSLAMLFREAITAAGLDIRLQIFASDKDADAVATARKAQYPAGIEATVTAARLARFFTRDEDVWQVRADLRALVVFTVQDVLTDPPFSRIDFISCRNLLIYLKPQAQARVAALFRFALRPGGILLLGSSENVGPVESGFSVVAKPERIWRRQGAGTSPSTLGFDTPATAARTTALPRAVRLAELCRRQVEQHHAPAAVLLDQHDRCLHAMGPTDRYLRHASGTATQALMAVVRPTLRARLQVALAAARASGQACFRDDRKNPCLEFRQVSDANEAFLLLCFIEAAPAVAEPDIAAEPQDAPRIATLERELETVRAELHGASQELERAAEESRAVNEEALSVNEEYQSTNEELLTSKEELQSLNEELTVLNGQLQETLEHSRTMSNDLQNVLYSTDEATIFLDAKLCIRFFTPATRAVFSMLPSDIGRPLADLRSLTSDPGLIEDAAAVLAGASPRLCEITSTDGTWFSRRVLPYRAPEAEVGGVVITFVDITARRKSAAMLAEATARAEQASAAKSRFLGAASHDLRQPLQTLTLLRDMLARVVQDQEAAKLIALQEQTLVAMSAMLDTLLDINQIETGSLKAEPETFPVGPLLDRLGQEFGYLARGRGLEMRVMPCALTIRSDPRLLEQMLRNLLSNALKCTRQGRILLGCRRRAGGLALEVWDTGMGIAEKDQKVIFDEYHQLDNAARERDRGLGLGLAIVRRLSGLLGHGLTLRSRPGHGSVFGITVPLASATAPGPVSATAAAAAPRTGAILVVEDEPDVRDLLVRVLREDGHRVRAAGDGEAALAMVAGDAFRPDIVLADFNLPGTMNGLQSGQALRDAMGVAVPIVILTADISTGTLRDIAARNCLLLHKPVRAQDLCVLMQRLLGEAPPPVTASPARMTLHVVEDDSPTRSMLRRVLAGPGQAVVGYPSAEAFLATYRPGTRACLLVDAHLPGMNGFDLIRHLREGGDSLPAIMITGFADVSAAIRAMKAGASDFIEKPVRAVSLRAAIARAMAPSRDAAASSVIRRAAVESLASLTPRQRTVMTHVLAGASSKTIAADLNISQRTVETHRAEIMRRSGASSLPALARLAMAAEIDC